MKNIKLLSAITAIMIAMTAAGCSNSEVAETITGNTANFAVDAGDATDAAADTPKSTAPATDSAKTTDSPDTVTKPEKGIAATEDITAGETFDAAIDSFSVKSSAEKSIEKSAELNIVAPDVIPEDDSKQIIEVEPEVPRSGLLTAGEWNDNNNWGFFTNLVNNDKISFPGYCADPRYRVAVTVTDSSDKPLANAKTRLLDKDGNVIWQAVTDKNGIAYLFGSENNLGKSVEVESGGKKQTFDTANNTPVDTQSVQKSGSAEMTVKFDGEGKFYNQNEIMFILDTTGSMGDEMLFLQSEFTAITNEIGTENTKYSVNFYRDEGDEYVTKCFDFTDNVADLQKKLNSETANGGGDLPEAVAEVLTETMNNSNWSDESVKLAFLIFDAPPHEEKAAETIAAVKKAAERGIRLIPIVSSNSDRDTEMFGRAAAITTGGTYVFLTDDSGIGESHLEPIIGDYKVEKLYDIIIRIINDYKQA